MPVYDMKDEIVDKVLEEIKDVIKSGISTGLRDIDYILDGGLQKGNVYVLGGRTGMGKTALAMNIAHYALVQDKKVIYISLEMSAQQVLKRMIPLVARVKYSAGEYDAQDSEKLMKAVEWSKEKAFVIDDMIQSIDEIICTKYEYLGYNEADLIVIDSLQLLEVSDEGDSRKQAMDSIGRKLKQFARKSGIPVLLISQLDGEIARRPDHRPVLSDIEEQGVIGQYADVVLFLYRDEYYNPDSESKGIAEIIVSKNRSGRTGTWECVWLADYLKFCNLEKE
ncbi:MAG: DnaB-like helicase C-terminal domain-containing protein [Lachnospiraceae bacterium]|nr:DnaB-like helicase C-terminal domain-containing protein [Lachnospiraceae bacterium]